MSNIDFLSDNKNGLKKNNSGKEREEKIEWTKPAHGKSVVPGNGDSKVKKGKTSSVFSSFFRKEKKEFSNNKTAVAGKFSNGGKSDFNNIDKEQLMASRQKILKQINKYKDKAPKESKPSTRQEKDKKEKNKKKELFSWKKSFKIKANNKEVKKEKPSSAKASEDKKDDDNKEKKLKDSKEEKIIVLTKEKQKKESLLDKLIENWRSRGKKKNNERINNDFLKTKLSEEKQKTKKKKENNIEKEALEWKSADILETNLVRDELVSYYNWKRGLVILLINIVFSCLIIVGAYEGIIIWGESKRNQDKALSERIIDLNKMIEPLEEYAKEIFIIQKRIGLASELLERHIYWTNFFKFLEDNTLADVYYLGGFSGNNEGEYGFSAKAKNIKTILKQVNVFRANEFVSNVNIGGGNIGFSNEEIINSEEDEEREYEIYSVNFGLELSIDPKLFNK